MKRIVKYLITIIARAYLLRYKPTIVAVTGNVGKTSTKEAIAVVLKSIKYVRAGGENLNNEFGVPLMILGNWSKEYYQNGAGPLFWFKVVLVGLLRLLLPFDYPQILVLEYGADRPGDIKRLTKLFPPNIAVVTAVGEVPVHVEYFSDPDEVAIEKSSLIRTMPSSGWAVLNYDDPAVLAMGKKTKARVVTFGINENASIRISGCESNSAYNTSFKLHNERNVVPVKINNVTGKAQMMASAAAAAVGTIFGMNLVKISEALFSYKSPAGRLRVLGGIKGTVILDDTYNAAPASMHIALEALRDLPARRKIAILGDMLELGKYSIKAHRTVGDLAGNIADVLICVGEKSKFIADSAANQMSSESIFTFHTSDDAKQKVQELIKTEDLILVKGSQGRRMEKIVEEIMAEPERASELLVRQSGQWKRKKVS